MASCFINEFLQQFPFRVITLGDGGVHFQKQLALGGGGEGGAYWEAPFSADRKASPFWVSQLGC